MMRVMSLPMKTVMEYKAHDLSLRYTRRMQCIVGLLHIVYHSHVAEPMVL